MNTALLLIDIQNDYFKQGKFPLFQTEEAADKAAEVLKYFRDKQLPVIHVQHISLGAGATFFLPDTEGVQIHQSVAPTSGETVIRKHAPNSFYLTELRKVLEDQKIEHLVVCGMMTHMCIDTSVRAAKDYGYKVTLIHDACTTRDLNGPDGLIDAKTVHNSFIAALDGMFAEVKKTEDFLR